MPETTKSSPVTVVYRHRENKILVYGNGIHGELNITGKELKNMYWKGEGKGSIEITIEE